MRETVPEDSMPPESLWHSPHKCKKWIDEHFGKKGSGPDFLEFRDTEVEPKS
jgi:hypothetical protein